MTLPGFRMLLGSSAALIARIASSATGSLRRFIVSSFETPIGGLAELNGGSIRLRGEILRTDGTEVFADDMEGAIEDGAEMGRAMAAKLLAQAGPDFF